MVYEVMIPVFRPDEKLDALLTGLLQQLMPPRRIILMMTEPRGEADETRQLEQRLRAMDERIVTRIIPQEAYDHAETRNRGVALMEADTEAFLMMTQDAVPADAHLTEHLCEALSDETAAVAYARQLTDKNASVPEKCARRFNYPAESMRKTKADVARLGVKAYFCSNVCAMYRKSVFDAIGGFEAPAIFNEDMVYAARALQAGHAVVYEAKAAVTHAHSYTLGMQFKRSFDNGASQAIHADIFEGIRTEQEGMRYVRETVRTLNRVRQSGRIPYFLLQCACRYAGFRMGKRCRRLSYGMRLRCSMNAAYWKKYKDLGTEPWS